MYGASIRELNIGPDKVHVLGDKVIVFASREMPDWTVREFCLPPIFIQGEKFYLKRKLPGPFPYAMRYELAPWTSEQGVESSRVIHYNDDYVAQRERDFTSNRTQDRLHTALIPFYPFLGFCWSGFKSRVLCPIGFEPVSVTTASILLCFGLFLLEAVFVLYFHLGFLGLVFSSRAMLGLDWLLFLLLPLDCVVRYDHVLRGDEAPDGFLEWIFRRAQPG